MRPTALHDGGQCVPLGTPAVDRPFMSVSMIFEPVSCVFHTQWRLSDPSPDAIAAPVTSDATTDRWMLIDEVTVRNGQLQ